MIVGVKMAIRISTENDPEAERSFFDDDDPVYWFLYPYFEKNYVEVGQMVEVEARWA